MWIARVARSSDDEVEVEVGADDEVKGGRPALDSSDDVLI